MTKRFDRRVIPEEVLALLRAIQRRFPSRLGGGAALSGAFLAHRLSRDVDVYLPEREAHRELVRLLAAIAEEVGLSVTLSQDAGSFVRATIAGLDREFAIDLVYEPAQDLAEPVAVEGVLTQSLADLRASKLTCLLSRSEPRDLVDVLFLERHGFPPEADLANAARKDTGIDPGILAWLLGQFPTSPLPVMLQPLTEGELLDYRQTLRERFRELAVPEH